MHEVIKYKRTWTGGAVWLIDEASEERISFPNAGALLNYLHVGLGILSSEAKKQNGCVALGDTYIRWDSDSDDSAETSYDMPYEEWRLKYRRANAFRELVEAEDGEFITDSNLRVGDQIRPHGSAPWRTVTGIVRTRQAAHHMHGDQVVTRMAIIVEYADGGAHEKLCGIVQRKVSYLRYLELSGRV